MNDRLPDFLIIGAAKCGTTSLYQTLTHHPDVYMCEPKEPEYFSDETAYSQGLAWYKHLFAEAADHQVCGEASTTYTRWPHTADVPPRIAAAVPDARFIYIMRDPVERAYSHYAHHMRLGVTMTFEEALERDSIYTDCGLYINQIRRYLEFYNLDSFLFLLSEDLKAQAESVLGSVYRFIGVGDAFKSKVINANRTGSRHYVRLHTVERVRSMPYIGKAVDAMPKQVRKTLFEMVYRSSVGRRIAQRHQLPPMERDTREMLRKTFREPNLQLAEFLNRDLSNWSS